MYCTIDLCQTVNKLKKEKKNSVSVQRSVYTKCPFCQLLKLIVLTETSECGVIKLRPPRRCAHQ